MSCQQCILEKRPLICTLLQARLHVSQGTMNTVGFCRTCTHGIGYHGKQKLTFIAYQQVTLLATTLLTLDRIRSNHHLSPLVEFLFENERWTNIRIQKKLYNIAIKDQFVKRPDLSVFFWAFLKWTLRNSPQSAVSVPTVCHTRLLDFVYETGIIYVNIPESIVGDPTGRHSRLVISLLYKSWTTSYTYLIIFRESQEMWSHCQILIHIIL